MRHRDSILKHFRPRIEVGGQIVYQGILSNRYKNGVVFVLLVERFGKGCQGDKGRCFPQSCHVLCSISKPPHLSIVGPIEAFVGSI